MRYSIFILSLLISSVVSAAPSAILDKSSKLDGCTMIHAFDDCFFKTECVPRVNQLIFQSGEGGYLNTRLHRDNDADKSYFYDVDTGLKVTEFGGRWVNEKARAYTRRSNRYSLIYYLNGNYRDGVRQCEIASMAH